MHQVRHDLSIFLNFPDPPLTEYTNGTQLSAFITFPCYIRCQNMPPTWLEMYTYSTGISCFIFSIQLSPLHSRF